MIAQLTNHLWQSTIFALAAASLTLVLRRNRAQVRYGLWFAASVKFLVPFAFLIAAGALVPLRRAPSVPAPAVPAAFAVAMEQIAQPFPDTFRAATAPVTRTVEWGPIVFGIWFAVCVAIVCVRLRAWQRVRRVIRESTPLALPVGSDALAVRSGPGLFEPGVVGIWHPTLLLPERISDCLTRDQLETVVVHEQCHVERRDNLTAAIHMAVETVFWFHPLVWWIGARMLAERERACDEAVLARGLQPRDYADAILNVCKLYVESPLACVAGVTGSNLERRIDDIMIERTGANLTFARKAVLGTVAIAALITPLAVGVVTAPLRAQGQTTGPVFDVASIKPCDSQTPAPGGRGSGAGPNLSPDRLSIDCLSVAQLINTAYIVNGERLLNGDPGSLQWTANSGDAIVRTVDQRVRGGPIWAHDEKFTIEAKAGGATDRKVLQGPMLRALLEERFHLKIHRAEDENVDMFGLTVAKGGPKITPWATENECTPFDRATQKPPPMKDIIEMVRRGEKPPCFLGVMGGQHGENRTFALNGQDMDGVAYWLSSVVGRHVFNRSGLTGKYTLYLEYAPDDSTADPAGASVFTAIQEQWGLKLEPAKGPRGYIVIDQVERPSIAGAPKFAAVSVRPCKGDDTPPGGRGMGPGPGNTSPGRLQLNCLPLVGTPSLMRQAYAVHATGQLSAYWVDLPVENAPPWTRSERYTVEAKAEDTPSTDMMRGPMLQAALEDAFHLKTHRETREVAVYELGVAKGGPRLRAFDHSCTPVDFTKPNLPAQLEATGSCPIVMAGSTVNAPGATIDDFIKFALTRLDRPVVNKTGLDGRFDIRVELSDHDDAGALTNAFATALQQQLGLKLTAAKGTGEVLVIDHVERPRAGG